MPQRYERISSAVDDDDHSDAEASRLAPAGSSSSPSAYPNDIPASPPPSFHSRASSPTASKRLLASDPAPADSNRELADAFDDSDDSDDEDGLDDRQRLMRGQPEPQDRSPSEPANPRQGIERRVTQLPVFEPPRPAATAAGRVYGGGQTDGVWANISAKPTRGEEVEEKPPTYEQAAADATPPYWETTILAPGSFGDEVYVEGLPVGSVFSFLWNAMISMSFELVGFLLTYLLHSTHAAKNGSRAGLGMTLVRYGFTMKATSSFARPSDSTTDFATSDDSTGLGKIPSDPTSHNFDPSTVDVGTAAGDGGSGSGGASAEISTNDWLAYGLMIVGWLILIRSICDFIRARRHEQLVLQSPDRGLGVAVVAEGETPDRVV